MYAIHTNLTHIINHKCGKSFAWYYVNKTANIEVNQIRITLLLHKINELYEQIILKMSSLC